MPTPRSPFLALAAILLPAAASAAPLYQATLAVPAVAATVVKDLRWQCAGTSCSAPLTATSSDSSVCAAVVRTLGPVTAFAAGARTFDPAQLERCNHAKR